MAIYHRGDVAWVWQIWEKEDGTIGSKLRPGIIYDVIGEDHYCILIFGTDRTGQVPGFRVEANSEEGISMNLDKDSFINLQKFVRLRKMDILKLKGHCPDSIMEKIEVLIDSLGIKRPLN